jgi:hypothetical protein
MQKEMPPSGIEPLTLRLLFKECKVNMLIMRRTLFLLSYRGTAVDEESFTVPIV